MKKPTIAAVAVLITGAALVHGAEAFKPVHPEQPYTGYPPAVYMRPFIACSADKPCTQTQAFRVNPVPKGCCVLIVTNGDGQGTDEVSSYEVFLNGQRVIPAGRARQAQASVKVLPQDNKLKVVLLGEPWSKVFILVAYDPRESK